MAIAAITEVGQNNRIVNRDGSLADFLADVAGIALVLIVYWLIGMIVSKPATRSEV